jgi:hypothetical protein
MMTRFIIRDLRLGTSAEGMEKEMFSIMQFIVAMWPFVFVLYVEFPLAVISN